MEEIEEKTIDAICSIPLEHWNPCTHKCNFKGLEIELKWVVGVGGPWIKINGMEFESDRFLKLASDIETFHRKRMDDTKRMKMQHIFDTLTKQD